MLLEVDNIEKDFGGLKALDGVSIEIEDNSITGLIGPNGSGKTTLFNIITGFYRPSSGHIYLRDQRIDTFPPHLIAKRGVYRTFQVSKAPQGVTVLENMLLASKNQLGEKVRNNFLNMRKVRDQEHSNLCKANSLLEFLELDHLRNELSHNLSGGQRKLLALGRILMARPQLTLLDEPTAGVNPRLTDDLIEAIKKVHQEQEGAFFIVEHKMEVIDKICHSCYVLDSGKVIAKGQPAEIRSDEQVLEAYLGGAEEN